MVYQETFVPRNQHRIYVRDYPGAEPTIVVMHGFPDNCTSTIVCSPTSRRRAGRGL